MLDDNGEDTEMYQLSKRLSSTYSTTVLLISAIHYTKIAQNYTVQNTNNTCTNHTRKQKILNWKDLTKIITRMEPSSFIYHPDSSAASLRTRRRKCAWECPFALNPHCCRSHCYSPHLDYYCCCCWCCSYCCPHLCAVLGSETASLWGASTAFAG